MQKSIFMAFAFLIMIGCSPKNESNKEDTSTGADTTASVTTERHNTLTQNQQAEGWKVLFDGKTMDGWHTFQNKENDSWEVIDGTLHCKPFKEDAENKRADLVTTGQYDNFEFSFDWKISPQGNSGVMFHVSEEQSEPYATGPEYQLLDDEGYPGDVKDVQLTGANYDMQAPSYKKLNPAGEWNSSKIVVNENKVEHWLNGDKVLTYEIGSAAWEKLKKESKWKDFPAYGTTTTGYLDLQDHGNEVWFRNLYIKTL